VPTKLAAQLATAPEPGFAVADGDRLVACLASGPCIAVDPDSGEVVGEVPAHAPPPESDPESILWTPAFPTPDNAVVSAVLDPSHRRAFVLGRDHDGIYRGDTYDVASGARLARVAIDTLSPGNGPPPPIGENMLAWRAGSVVIGSQHGYALIVDPDKGEVATLEPGWIYLGDHLLVGHDWLKGDIVVYDISAGAHPLGHGHFNDAHPDGRVVEVSIAAVGARAVAVGFAPLVTVQVDRFGTVSPPRPLPTCAD
jgi:hypothetical protein